MGVVGNAVLLTCLVAMATAQIPDPTISNNGGLEFRLPDNNYRQVILHYNVNKPLHGVAAGDYTAQIDSKTGNEWVHTDSSVQLQPGDTVSYWLIAFTNTGEGLQITDRTFTYVQTTPTTTTTTTTRRPVTAATTTGNPPGSHSAAPGTGSGSHAGSGSGIGSHAGSSSNTGSGHNAGIPDNSESNGRGSEGGSCGHCQYGPGYGDGFVDDRTCSSFPCLIFEDDFDFLNHRVWEHELTASGGGNWEFQYYTNNRSNSYTRDGILYLKPTLTADHYGREFLEQGTLDLWGGSAADVCTSNMDWGCKREGRPGQMLNPIQSARIRSSRGFNFRYGKVEVEAKLPAGDWLWPAIWMLPRLNVYGKWPASGEIDIMESRGNTNYRSPQGTSLGNDAVGSTLHFGADFGPTSGPRLTANKGDDGGMPLLLCSQLSGGTFNDDFHKFGVEWDDTAITFTVDHQEILRVAPGNGGFWEFGGLDQVQGQENPWRGGTRMAPFDQEFYLIMNVAVGGVGFFKDENRNSPHPKPWQDGAGHESDRFWAARDQWYPTWHPDQNNGEDAALQVNYVRVWKTKPDP